jgi:hypothetical protein
LRRRGGLEQEPRGACPEGVHHVVVKVERGQHHHAGRGQARQEPSGRLYAVDFWHPDVHQHEIRRTAQRLGYGLAPVSRLGDDLDVRLGLEYEPDAATDQRLIVGEQHPDHVDILVSNGIRARTR